MLNKNKIGYLKLLSTITKSSISERTRGKVYEIDDDKCPANRWMEHGVDPYMTLHRVNEDPGERAGEQPSSREGG
jgi:hypothetical protein